MSAHTLQSRRGSLALAAGAVVAVAVAAIFASSGELVPDDERPTAVPSDPLPRSPERAGAEAPRSAPAVPGQAAAPTAPAALPAVALPLTSLPLRLLVTSARGDATKSFARMEDLDHEGLEILKEGQRLRNRPDVKLAGIEPDSVVLDNDGALERLLLDRLFALEARGRAWLVFGVFGTSMAAAGVVMPSLLATDALGLPAVVFRSFGNVVQTLAEMTFGTAAALLVPRLVLWRRRV